MKLSIILLAVAGLAMCNNTKADCYTRSDLRLIRSQIDAGPTDFQRIVTPDPKGSKCSVRYRVHVGNEWKTVEGTAVARTESEACTRAADLGEGKVLVEIEPSQISSDLQMVCSDVPDIRVRRVRAGETVWESETEMHTNPEERKYFNYKGTRCRTFVERGAKDQNLYLYQGIMCRADDRPESKWLVVDKY